MRTLRKVLLSGLSVAFAVLAAEPPADVDAALRSRIHDFYQLQVDRKFRQAEQLVAADTKDFYYESKKPDIRAFKIVSIQYAPDFQSAKVMLSSRATIMFPGTTVPKELDVPFTSTWKIDGGQWCWYVDQSALLDTPFGRVKGKTDSATEDVAKLAERAKAGSMDGVHADVTRIPLDPDHPKPQIVTLKNTLPGPVTIQSLTNSPALKIEIAKADLGAEESTTVTITPVAGNSDRPGQLTLRIGPLGQLIQIGLDYPPAK
jgi:hypothetical protein